MTDAHETRETPGARDDDPNHFRISHVLHPLTNTPLHAPLMHLTPCLHFSFLTPLQHSTGEQNSLGRPHQPWCGNGGVSRVFLFLPL
jgi:hypothetical protein